MLKKGLILAAVLLVQLPVYAQQITHAVIASSTAESVDAAGNRILGIAGQSIIGVTQSAGATNRTGFVFVATRAGEPVVETNMVDVDLIAGGEPLVIQDLGAFFSDPDADPLSFSARSTDAGVAEVGVSGSQLTITPQAVGTATIIVTAEDGRGGRARMSFVVAVPTGVAVERSEERPRAFALGQNYPNPFNPSTTIHFDVPEATEVALTVYNLMGQAVASLESGFFPPGQYVTTWDATGVASGTYVYRLQAGAHVATKRMVLLK